MRAELILISLLIDLIYISERNNRINSFKLF